MAPGEKENTDDNNWSVADDSAIHAIANGIYVAAVNRTGFEGPPDHGLEFWGSSFVADPFGQMIGKRPRIRKRSW